MSGDGPILAWLPIYEVEQTRPPHLTQIDCLKARLSEILRGKLGLLSFRFASQKDARNAYINCRRDSQGSLDPEGIKSALRFIPAESLVLEDLQITDDSLTGHLEFYVNEDSPIQIRAEASQRDFLECLDELAFNFASHFMSFDDPKFIRQHLESFFTTTHFDALQHFADAHFHWQTRDLDQAEAAIQKAREADGRFATPLRYLAEIFREAGLTERELDVIREEVALHETEANPYRQTEATMRLAHAHVFAGKWEQAIELYDACEEQWEELAEHRLAIQARSNRANVYLRQGHIELAIKEYNLSLEQLDDTARDKGQLLYNLSLALGQTQQFEEALKILEQALVFAKKRKDMRLICRIYNARGAVCDELEGEYLEQALSQYRMAEEYFGDDDDPTLLAGIKDHIAITYRKLGRFEQALEYSAQACTILEKRSEDGLHLAIAQLNRASLLMDLGRREEARELAQSAHDTFELKASPHLETARQFLESLNDGY